MKSLTEGKTLGSKKGSSKRPNRPPPSPNPKREPRIKEIYCLQWKQTGNIPVLQGYVEKSRAYRHANSCNGSLQPNFFQRLLGRYWIVVAIKVMR